MQLPANQPTPWGCPPLSPFAFGLAAETRPTTSWPRIAGYCELPHSLLKTERSERHTPQCSTATSTSSAPSGPRATFSSPIGCFAAFVTHALQFIAPPIPKLGLHLDTRCARHLHRPGAHCFTSWISQLLPSGSLNDTKLL